jgi:hypothetical protein
MRLLQEKSLACDAEMYIRHKKYPSEPLETQSRFKQFEYELAEPERSQWLRTDTDQRVTVLR